MSSQRRMQASRANGAKNRGHHAEGLRKSLQNLFLVQAKRRAAKTDYLPNEPSPENEQS